MKALTGHVSFETAFLVKDYPAGFTKRVQKKMWIETKKGKGQRGVSNTSTDITGKRWCAPKPNTYDALCGIFQVEASDVGQPHGRSGAVYTAEEVGHVMFMRVGNGGDVAFLERFNSMFGPFDTEYERETMRAELSIARATERRETEWKPEHPEPKYESGQSEWHSWHIASGKALVALTVEESDKIKASDEVPEPKVAPVAPAQDVVPEGAMF